LNTTNKQQSVFFNTTLNNSKETYTLNFYHDYCVPVGGIICVRNVILFLKKGGGKKNVEGEKKMLKGKKKYCSF